MKSIRETSNTTIIKYDNYQEFLDINKAGGVEVEGLTRRRKAEAKLFLS